VLGVSASLVREELAKAREAKASKVMEQKDRMLMHCLGKCGQSFLMSRHDLRRTRRFDWDCHKCGHKDAIDVNSNPELLAEILTVTIGENSTIDARNISLATAEQSMGTITLRFLDGENMEVHTVRFSDDVQTLETSGIAVVVL
jgi:hypothetical protein